MITANRYQIISKYLEEKYRGKNITLLDVGCGGVDFITFVNKLFPEYEIIGVDKNLEILLEDKKNLENAVELVNADGRKLPFKEKSIDVVQDIGCSTGRPEEREIINECIRVCKKEYIRFSDEKFDRPLKEPIYENKRKYEEMHLKVNKVYADSPKKRLLFFLNF